MSELELYVCLAICAVVVPGYIVYMLWRGVKAVREELRAPEPTPPPDAVERSLALLAREMGEKERARRDGAPAAERLK